MVGDDELWAHQIADLQDDVNLLPLELRGSSVSEFADHVLKIAPRQFNLAGLSLGGQVAFEIMRRAPISQMLTDGPFSELIEQLLPAAIHDGPAADPSLIGRRRDMATRCGSKRLFARNLAMMNRDDSRPILTVISCPTIVVAGRQDRMATLAEAEEIGARIRGARLIVIAYCGHLSSVEKPVEVSRALRDLLQQPVRSA